MAAGTRGVTLALGKVLAAWELCATNLPRNGKRAETLRQMPTPPRELYCLKQAPEDSEGRAADFFSFPSFF